MKKYISTLAITLILVICTNIVLAEADFVVMNEDFNLRNGIQFNSSLDDIKAVEAQNGSLTLKENQSNDNTYGLLYEGKIAGHGDSALRYVIRKSDDKLYQISYRIGAFGTSRDAADKSYKEMEADLEEKYGKPSYSSLTSVRPFFSDVNGVDDTYSQWIIEYNDCYVIMTLSSYEFTMFMPDLSKKSYGWIVNIYYNLFSKDEMKAMISEKEKDKAQKNTDF